MKLYVICIYCREKAYIDKEKQQYNNHLKCQKCNHEDNYPEWVIKSETSIGAAGTYFIGLITGLLTILIPMIKIDFIDSIETNSLMAGLFIIAIVIGFYIKQDSNEVEKFNIKKSRP